MATDVAVPAVQVLQDEIKRRRDAESRVAAITDERDSALAECDMLQTQLHTMQQDLDSAHHMMQSHQGCEGLLSGQGCEGQPSGIGDVHLGSDAEEAGNHLHHVNHVQRTFLHTMAVGSVAICLCCKSSAVLLLQR